MFSVSISLRRQFRLQMSEISWPAIAYRLSPHALDTPRLALTDGSTPRNLRSQPLPSRQPISSNCPSQRGDTYCSTTIRKSVSGPGLLSPLTRLMRYGHRKDSSARFHLPFGLIGQQHMLVSLRHQPLSSPCSSHWTTTEKVVHLIR
jgi:hypothetical protein